MNIEIKMPGLMALVIGSVLGTLQHEHGLDWEGALSAVAGVMDDRGFSWRVVP